MVQLKDHQKLALRRLDNGKILHGGVGSGKTYTSLAYYAQREAPRDLYIITTAKLRDDRVWHLAGTHFGCYPPELADHPGTVGTIYVDSWNNIGKYREVKDAFFIFDEQRLVGSGAWVKSFYKIAKSNRWILLSGTPGDNWLDYIPTFVANGYYRNKTDFVDQHVVYDPYSKFPKVKRYLGVSKLNRIKSEVLVAMPFERHTKRHEHIIPVDYDRDLLRKVMKERWHVYEERPLKNVAELFLVMRRVVNSHSSRLEKVQTLLSTHPRVIVFYNFDFELRALRGLTTPASDPLTSPASVPNTIVNDTKTGSTTTPFSRAKMDGTSSLNSKDGLGESSMKNSTDECLTKTGRLTSGSATTPACVLESGRTETSTSVRTHTPADTGYCGQDQTEFPDTGTSATHVACGETRCRMDERSTTTTSTSTGTSGSTPPSFAVAEWNGHKHEPIPESDRWVYLVQYMAGAEGWNCTTTDTMLFYSLTYSYKHFEQAKGRIDRLDTPFTDLNYNILRSSSVIDLAIWKSLKQKQSFSEADFRAKMGDFK